MACYFLKFYVSTGLGPKGGMTKLHAFWTKKVTKITNSRKRRGGLYPGWLTYFGIDYVSSLQVEVLEAEFNYVCLI
jgi:hypothetical protein